jgi:rhodanese-related sulfurtransferase
MRTIHAVVVTILLLGGALRAEAAYLPPLVDPEDVTDRQAGGERLLLVDIRTPAAYKDEHIYGACNVPFLSLLKAPRGLPRDRTLVLYCTCPEEHGSIQAAAKLHDRFGFRKLVVLRGGLDAWREAGYKVVEAPSVRAVTHLPSKVKTPAPKAVKTPAPGLKFRPVSPTPVSSPSAAPQSSARPLSSATPVSSGAPRLPGAPVPSPSPLAAPTRAPE